MKQILFLAFVILTISCDSILQNKKEQAINYSDTLNYSKQEYERIRKTLLDDTEFISFLTKKIPEGDTNTISLQRLLHTPYDHRLDSIKLSSLEINVTLYNLNLTRELFHKMNAIDSTLPDPTTIKSETDSIIHEMESIRKELGGHQ